MKKIVCTIKFMGDTILQSSRKSIGNKKQQMISS